MASHGDAAQRVRHIAEQLVAGDFDLRKHNHVPQLLAVFRLLNFDSSYRRYVRPSEVAQLLCSNDRAVVYLAIRILQICLDGADHWFEEMIVQYLGADSPDATINGPWDDRIIDYRFLTLWEEDHYERISKDVESALAHMSAPIQQLRAEELAVDLVQTPTTKENLRVFVRALESRQPILLGGPSGSGKSLLVQRVARALGRSQDMITLHLNEQSDAKLLLGIYTTGDTPGSFVWKAGVLTQAVEAGRWVLIEDLNRAPNEIIGMLLPLIEKRELTIPNRKQTMRAAPGFRILATVRTTLNHRGERVRPLTQMLGARHWQYVNIELPSTSELQHISAQLFLSISQLLPQVTALYERLSRARTFHGVNGRVQSGVARDASPRDLLKLCSRLSKSLQQRSSLTAQDFDHIFLESMDCFAGALRDEDARNSVSAIVAEELRIDPQRRDYLLTERTVRYEMAKSSMIVGRYSLPHHTTQKATQAAFSLNPHTCRMLEKVAAAVVNREPLLLVGETGVGKTTAVQHLASSLGKKLVPFNLSQQSEAGDLLGGFKPLNERSLIMPLHDEFHELFTMGFSRSKNQQFLELLGKQIAKNNWKAVCKLWRQALQMVDGKLAEPDTRSGEAPNKKRKLESKKTIPRDSWQAFAARVYDLERQLSAGNSTFAFNFVEGAIVHAVRNGDWVLLDEINLASSDTLESIVDLLDEQRPSLLLTESGSVQRVDAHPDFRIFGAMNPATDVGKKDLPPGIRSRFTELFVESPDKDLQSLQSIVRSYLRHETASDTSAAHDVSVTYQKIIGLAAQNRLVDGAGQKPHFSLRTLTRTLGYAKYIAPLCGTRRALYEGFHMSFMTFLDLESSVLVEPLLEQHLLGKRPNIRSELSKPLRKPADGHKYVQGFPASKHWIRQGDHDIEEQPHYILTPFVRRNLENLVRASSTRKFPVLIQGPTSSGKTSMIEYLAKRSGHKFVRINNHEFTDLQEYLGTYISDANGRLLFQEGVLVKALREGAWIVLDELNLAPTEVLEALNRLLDDNRELLLPETQEVVRPHENFMLFATQNPAGLYGGRKTLSRAFRNRFLELHFDDIPIVELQEILHKRSGLPESRCKRIVAVYKELSILRQESRIFEQKSFATLRDLFRWASRTNDTIDQLAGNGFMLLSERVRNAEERQAVKDVVERVMSSNGPRVRIEEHTLYSPSAPELLQYQQVADSHGVVWTKAMRRLYCLVARAIQNDEPVLLVGETGCGKTTACQMLASAFQKTLHAVNAHQNTETGDIVGSQRPVRNRAAIETSLRRLLTSSELLQVQKAATAPSIEDQLAAFDAAIARLPSADRQTYQRSTEYENISLLRTRLKALFEWSDGSLIQAMKEGNYFLLDEISLADDSVLERINSVLESSRSILLAEKGSLDSLVSAAPGFQFFATMNPGGDYGKRELSPALRNRFTEIWVPSLSDVDDVTQIVEAKLAEEVRPFASSIVSFAHWFNERYNTSASSSVSIRDVLSMISFVNIFRGVDVVASIVHAAAMVYIDTLGANPAGLITISKNSLATERHHCLSRLSELLNVDAQYVYEFPITMSGTPEEFFVGPFALARSSNRPAEASPFSFEPPTTRRNAMRVARSLQLQKPVLLEGDPGVGKTALVTAIAQAVGAPLTRINLSEQTDLLDLFGSDVPAENATAGTFAWRDAPFLSAMKNGEWVLLDEMNLASQSVLEGLNACLDHRGEVYVPELGQSYQRHPKFRLFAAQNPHHQGGGRKGLPASFVNRFTVVYADALQADDLTLISSRAFPQLQSDTIHRAISFVEQLEKEFVHHKRIGTLGGPWEFNLRDITRWLGLVACKDGLLESGTSRDFVEMLFSQRFRSASDREFVSALFTKTFQQDGPASDLYLAVSTDHLQVGIGLVPRNDIETQHRHLLGPSLRPDMAIIQSMLLCIQQRWPIILTGASGTGKTALVDALATIAGAEIATIAMNSETDAMDLIGGYEQADPQQVAASIMLKLRLRIRALAKMRLSRQSSTLTTLLEAEDRLDLNAIASELQSSNAGVPGDIIDEIDRLLQDLRQQHGTQVDKARFEWVDGPLVEALEHGKWLVLDNANLCSSSVLDRLNSLLEPNGSLMLNEHSGADGTPRSITSHPDFRIFLLYDPRYGELSRAMRNRAVELHIAGPSDHNGSPLASLCSESAMARLRCAKGMHSGVESGTNNATYARIVADHFGQADACLAQRYCAQLRNGLYGVAAEVVSELETAFNTASRAAAECAIGTDLCRSLAANAQVPADLASVQTLHSLNNQALFSAAPEPMLQALLSACQFDALVASAPISSLLQRLQQDTALTNTLRRLERAAGLNTSKLGGRGSIVLVWIQRGLDIMAESLHCEGLSASRLEQLRLAVQRLCSSWSTLLSYVTSEHMDAAALATYWITCSSMVKRQSLNIVSAAQVPALRHQSAELSDDADLQASICVALWQGLHQDVPSTMEDLQRQLQLEAMAERFDAICRDFALPIENLLAIRKTLARVMATQGSASQMGLLLLSEAEVALGEAESVAVEDNSKRHPHFTKSFQQLLPRLALMLQQGKDVSQDDLGKMELFALQKTPASDMVSSHFDHKPYHKALRILSGFVEPSILSSGEDEAGVGAALFTQLRSTANVSLSNMQLLQDEVRLLGKTLAAHTEELSDDESTELRDVLHSLVHETLLALTLHSSDTDIKTKAEHLLCKLQPGLHTCVNGASVSAGSQSPWPGLEMVVATLAGVAHSRSTAEAWAAYSISALQLYLPQGLFDPALHLQFHHNVHAAIVGDLENQLQSFLTFRSRLTGTTDTVRSRLLRQDLANAESPPPIKSVCRPPISRLTELHADFGSLKRIVRLLVTTELPLQSALPLDNGVYSNLVRIRSRLRTSYREYDDLAGPAAAMVDCLLFASDLATRNVPSTSVGIFASDYATVLPFVCASWSTWSNEVPFLELAKRAQTWSEKLLWLEATTRRSQFLQLPYCSTDFQDNVDAMLAALHQDWKIELTQDQESTAAKASLYRYKAHEEAIDDPTAEDLEEVFPTGEASIDQNQSHQFLRTKQGFASHVAALHASMFADKPNPNFDDLSFFATYKEICSDAPVDKITIPALIVAISDESGRLSGESQQSAYDLYKHPNINQVKLLGDHLERIIARFRHLHNTFPEHATPVEVLRMSESILQISHTTPLGELLPIVGKLHQGITQWQSIASREHSAAIVLDSLTSLIISWRQLELSSWAGLFEGEWQRAQRDAASWWYIAYENIIATLPAADGPLEVVQPDLEALLSTLVQFVESSGLGEYRARLDILRAFEQHLLLLCRFGPHCQMRYSAIRNFNAYYARFEPKVASALTDGRQKLEKAVKEVIQIASWKDRNVEVLQQSAKSSHMKLLRLVRKFRILLSQPVGPLLSADTQDSGITDESAFEVAAKFPSLAPGLELDMPQLGAWKNRPARFRNIGATSTAIHTKLGAAFDGLSISEYLSSFVLDVRSSMADLQKATPPTLTDENKPVVTHLRTQKRRLLADVLRHLREMGFQTSLSDQVLQRQESQSRIFSQLPAFVENVAVQGIAKSRDCFFRFIEILPAVLAASRKHSDDLSSQEVSRCTSLLRSIVDTSITQHKLVAGHLAQLAGLEKVVGQLRNFAACSNPIAVSSRAGACSNEPAKLSTLSAVVSAARKILGKQNILAGRPEAALFDDTLRQTATQLKQLSATIFPTLPSGIVDNEHCNLLNESRGTVAMLRAAVQNEIHAHPQSGAVLSHVYRWIEPDDHPRQDKINGHIAVDAETTIVNLFSTLDGILTAVQKVERATSAMSQVERSRQNQLTYPHLVNRQAQEGIIFAALNVSEIAEKLAAIANDMQHTDPAGEMSLSTLSAVVRTIQPLLEAYYAHALAAVQSSVGEHAELSNMGTFLATTFINMAERGFCSPTAKAPESSEQHGDVEAGTGLGDGEGAEDISKDIGDDEDLSDIAADRQRDGQGEVNEDERDAVDMADEQFEGALDQGEGNAVDDEGGSDSLADSPDFDEQVGEGDLGADAVDEKMWDQAPPNEDKQTEGDGKLGQLDAEDNTAAGQDQDGFDDGEEENVEQSTDAPDEARQPETEQPGEVEPHTKEDQNLDLPEDLVMDGDKRTEQEDSDIESMSDGNLSGERADDLPSHDGEEQEHNGGDAANQEDHEMEQNFDQELERAGENAEEEQDASMDTTLQQQNQDNQDDPHNEINFAESGFGQDDTTNHTQQIGQLDGIEETDEMTEGAKDNQTSAGANTKDESSGQEGQSQQASSKTPQLSALQRLGDVLERWYDQHREIERPSSPGNAQQEQRDDFSGSRFEHLRDEAEADTQALGAAPMDQSAPLDRTNALPTTDNEDTTAFPEDTFGDDEPVLADESYPTATEPQIGMESQREETSTVVGEPNENDGDSLDVVDQGDVTMLDKDDVEDIDGELTNTHLSAQDVATEMSAEEAQRHWSDHEESTRNLALILTEHLRLILHPTQATRMRGDFRTGKRLNIKRIIPYIASSYKRDKIWMRRSVPSKRSYQVMLAIDDSKSMTESQSNKLAFDTLALVAKSLTMLEVGDLCVLGFGEDVNVAHEFESTFVADAGPKVLQRFTFSQDRTDVQNLLTKSIELFRSARLRATGSASDLWQLQLIISDGICEDHPRIRQLVRQAHEERIMVVFIVVNSAAQAATSVTGPTQSIFDLQKAEFVKDTAGEMQLRMTKYLDTFPFRYYLVVRNVQDLPDVLAGALRQWFAETVGAD